MSPVVFDGWFRLVVGRPGKDGAYDIKLLWDGRKYWGWTTGTHQATPMPRLIAEWLTEACPQLSLQAVRVPVGIRVVRCSPPAIPTNM